MRVMYVPQRPALLPGSPDKFIESIVQLGSHQTAHRGLDPKGVLDEVKARAHKIALGWDIDPELWQRDWINLSGGEGQRMLLASALAFDVAEVMLLDEPTSALDPETSALVEQTLVDTVNSPQSTLKALIWITHSPDQSKRVGNRYFFMSGGTCIERADPSPSPYPPSLAASGSQTSLVKP
ncbi:hypothetical protein CVT24_010551 [Panaeolus cyanescens]|uniref:ABC transporter domain-containing protein n=1 Tax=Panaeolus cyanescens TaxID=181874 RepID=A0A409YYJ2_9AGAR|nr:hypothetical protein CVT24_010551 [Panaeolus cyanescens]